MKSLLILALCIISLTQIKSQGISREWLSDWQNQAISGCYPDNFTITGTGTDSSPYTIEYNFPADNYWLVCYEYAHGGVAATSNLYSYSTNVYNDSNYNIILTYDPTTESVSASFYNQSKPFLYTIDGTSIQQQAALGNVGRTWSNKSPASGNSGNCCVPDSIFIALANPQFYLLAEFNALYYYNTTNCAKNSTYNYQLSVANPVSLNWAGSNVSNPSGLIDQIALTPDEFSEQWTFFLSANNGTCNYSYTPVNTRAHPSYSYVQDWQTTPDKYSPSSYAVTTESGAYSDFDYMVSTVTLPNGTTYKSYLVENPQGLYFDPYVNINGTYFSFDSDTYSLLSVSTNPATEDALLLSTSGSIFTATDFESGWTSAVSTNGEALPSDCCIPSYIAIAANETEKNELSVIYYFDSDYLNNTGCQDIQYSIYNYQLESTLSIETPSVTQLVWTDLYGHQIFFTYPTETDEIQVSNFLGQCSFNMIPTSTAPPTPPAPSSASVISIGTMTLVSGLLIIFNLF